MVTNIPGRTRACWAAWIVAGALLAGGAGLAAEPKGPPVRLKSYSTRYYLIQSDLQDPNAIREASARMTAMAEEYHRRTKDFAGAIQKRFTFCLFSKEKDYHDAGGPLGSGGVYDPSKEALMAFTTETANNGSGLWHVVQHEGFHQFVHLVIGGHLPIWINEGLAEYFAEGIWTGDGFVTGLIPPWRLKRVQEAIRQDRMVPFLEMLMMSAEEWSGHLRDSYKGDDANSGKTPIKPSPKKPVKDDPKKTKEGKGDGPDKAETNYDQAWAMVHFLVHADNGKYRDSFGGLLNDVSHKKDWQQSFKARFGSNVKVFEKKYSDWWLAQDEKGSQELYIRTVVQTLTSFLARAVAQGQKFADADEFFAQARAGTLKCDKAQWLPPGLLADTLKATRNWKDCWSLEVVGRYPRLVLTWTDDKVYVGTFAVVGGKPANVKADIQQKKP
jgi:hypothetical protein